MARTPVALQAWQEQSHTRRIATHGVRAFRGMQAQAAEKEQEQEEKHTS
eukprot:CAMPEP_0206506484 /NCGR_PEP_ID=MMETSP0324_2-20121206/56796_1 /ASSEMBLY_ACC=CAM_ASM_000836 /TAXON_ID=2866 /ORGANISM="Crypthecodinium cohnii, Strain Seligo" /LENGTH=48 /DNA_ID= /DNA_START= /DNA_END= /DNA_ORIENTATION=